MNWFRIFIVCCGWACLLVYKTWTDFWPPKLLYRPDLENHKMDEVYLKQYLEQDCLKPTEMKSKKYQGKMNVHRWFDSCTCGSTIDTSFRIYTRFPRQPELQTITSKVELTTSKLDYSQRIFGYIRPNKTGIYRFAISSKDNSELWISKDSSPKNVQLVAYVNEPSHIESDTTDELRRYSKYKEQKSAEIHLKQGEDYYLEALHRSQTDIGYISIAWQTPGTSDFIPIESSYLSLYLPDDNDNFTSLSEHKECIMIDHKPLFLREMPPVTLKQLYLEKDEICTKYPIVNHREVADVLTTCPYEPTYKPKKTIGKYFGANYYAQTFMIDFYPDDKTSYTFFTKLGNRIIDTKEVDSIVDEYMDTLRATKGRKYRLKKVVNVEKKTDKVRGNRYLLELEMEKDGGQPVLLSEYVFKFNQTFAVSNNLTTDLCYPERLQWNRTAKVYLILPVKNYGYWVKYLIDELVKIYTSTTEKNFHLVIIDFNSTDFNSTKYLEKSVLSNSYTVLQKTGPFHKPIALNSGVASVKDPNSIIFLMDLHITFPPCFFDIIRKHTIKGISGFFPDLLRLKCATSDKYPNGNWDLTGYGLLGIYKEDWDRFGGFDADKYTSSWGGEDWDLLDSVLNAKFEVERFKWPKMFHFPHARKGDWYKKTSQYNNRY